MKPTRKIISKFCFAVIAGILIIIAVLFFYNIQNTKKTEELIEDGLNIINEKYELIEDEENEYEKIKIYGILNFDVYHYYIEDLGHLCIMKANMGIMQMATLVLTPYEKQMPMLSVDYMNVLNTHKINIGIFNLVPNINTDEYQDFLAKEKTIIDDFSDIEDNGSNPVEYSDLITVGVHKVCKSDEDERIKSLFKEVLKKYMEESVTLQPLDKEEKSEKWKIIKEYCDKSIEEGGFATDVFKKNLGEDMTRDIFYKVIYGPEYARQYL